MKEKKDNKTNLKLFSKMCLEKNIGTNKLDLNSYLDTLNQILNYNDIFGDINEKYQENIIDCLESDNLKTNCNEDYKISLCMIVKDEEQFIARTLENHLKLFDELVIVDTGSIDKTESIIRKYMSTNPNIKLASITWNNDFSEARNYAKTLATNNWILFLDADEILDEKDATLLYNTIELFNKFPFKQNVAFVINAINVEQNLEVTTMQRFFYNNKNFSYYGLVHEYLITSDDEQRYLGIHLNLRIKHDGYNKDVIAVKNKNKRNILLLEKMMQLDPDNLRWLYYYTRDGIDLLPNDTLVTLILNKLEINKMNYGSLDLYKDYVLELLQNLFIIMLRQQNIIECKKVLPLLERRMGESYDVFFYKIYLDLIEGKNKMFNLLKNTLEFRKSHFNSAYSLIDNNGYHIDLLIAMLLFEVGDYEKSKKYFDFLQDKLDYKQYFADLKFIELL